jgi:hypothetical protein
MHGSGMRGCTVSGAARATAVTASSSRTTQHATDLIALPPQPTPTLLDPMMFKPIRVKLALRLR